MPTRKRKNDSPIGIGMTAKQMRRKKPINTDLLVDIDPLTDEKLAKLKNKIEVHVKYTDSQVGKRIIGNWSEEHKLFKLVFPKDYKRVLLAIEKARKEGTSEELAIMEAAHG